MNDKTRYWIIGISLSISFIIIWNIDIHLSFFEFMSNPLIWIGVFTGIIATLLGIKNEKEKN